MEIALTHNKKFKKLMALGDITVYSSENGHGYPGERNITVVTAATVPTFLSGEPVGAKAGLGAGYPIAVASSSPVIVGYGSLSNQYLYGIAGSTSNEATSGAVNGSVSVIPADEPITYLISTLATATYFGNPATSQITYDALVGSRVTFGHVGGVGANQIGGTYYINSTDATGNALIVESLDITKYPGKVRFSIRKGAGYNF